MFQILRSEFLTKVTVRTAFFVVVTLHISSLPLFNKNNKTIVFYKVLTVCVNLCSADELLLTEMVFNGLFNDLTVEQATALLSCFVFQENV